MFRFMNPQYFNFFWLLLVVVFFFFFLRKLKQKKLKMAFGEKMLPFFMQGMSIVKTNFKFTLGFCALSLMVIAIARPQLGKGQTKIKSEGVELMIALDVSNSMLTEDVKPSRLEHAKKEINRLLNQMAGHKVGLLAFAGSAILLSPLTSDKSALRMYLETMSPNSVETQGTELGRALEEAASAMDRGGEEKAPESRVTRVIVVISDGEDHEEGALKKAKEIAGQGVRVFTMAFGTERGSRVPRRDDRGILRGYQKNSSGEDVVSKVNGEVLRQIARAGKGSFYHVTFGGNHMKNLLEDLDRLEKSEFDSLNSESFSEKYQWPLFFGFLLALLELLLGTRRKLTSQWQGRFTA